MFISQKYIQRTKKGKGRKKKNTIKFIRDELPRIIVWSSNQLKDDINQIIIDDIREHKEIEKANQEKYKIKTQNRLKDKNRKDKQGTRN